MRFFKTLLLAGLVSLILNPAFGADLWRPEGQPAFLDSNGNPYASAKLCYFDAGTTDEKTVYKDSSASTAWAQPISLNSAGALADPVYVPTGAFKEVFLSSDATTCSNGTTLWTSDNIPGALDVNELGIDYAKPDRPVLAKASNYTVQISDLGKVFNVDATGGAVTITLPSAITAGDGAILTVKKSDSSASTVSLATVGSQTIDGASSYALSQRYDTITIVGDGANWHTYDAVVPGSIAFADLASSTYDTDGTLAANSNSKVPTQRAVKTYADTLFASGIAWLDPVVAASTTSLTKSSDVENGDTLDGVTLSTGDRVLLKDQSSAAENGVWVVAASGAPTRSTDLDEPSEFTGATVYVSGGSANAGNSYTQTATVTTPDTSDVDWALIASALTYSGDEVTITKSGTTFSVKDGGIDSDAIATGAVGADEIAAGSIPKTDLVTAVQQALVPVGTVVDYAGTSAPSGWLLAYGQCVDDTTYSDLDAVLGSTWDTVNGCSAGEVGIPDLRGRVVAGQDDMGGVSANRLLGTDTDGVGVNGDTLGAVGGEERTTDNVDHTHTGSVSGAVTGSTASAAHTHSISFSQGIQAAAGGGSNWVVSPANDATGSALSTIDNGSLAFSDSFTTSSDGDASVTNMQPTMILNKIIKF